MHIYYHGYLSLDIIIFICLDQCNNLHIIVLTPSWALLNNSLAPTYTFGFGKKWHFSKSLIYFNSKDNSLKESFLTNRDNWYLKKINFESHNSAKNVRSIQTENDFKITFMIYLFLKIWEDMHSTIWVAVLHWKLLKAMVSTLFFTLSLELSFWCAIGNMVKPFFFFYKSTAKH